MTTPKITRRSFLKTSIATSGLLLAGCEMGSAPRELLPLTPACGDDHDHDYTPTNTEGPFFTPDSPESMSMREGGDDADLLRVSGQVLSTECNPVPNALVDFWHANPSGEYDNVGYKFRAHQFTDAEGRYELLTVMPGIYPGRTRHIHVKVQPPNGDILTTQLYFPDEAANFEDDLIIQSLIMQVEAGAPESHATFNFVVPT